MAYARLAKTGIGISYFFSAAVVASALVPAGRLGATSLGVLLLFLAGEVAVFGAVAAFDDVTGFRDSSDEANYLGDGSGLRPLARKPLLTGVLTVGQAVRFGYGAAIAAWVLWALAGCLAPYRPWWALAGGALILLASVQYSWGLKLSYHGGSEAVIGLTALGFVLVPYGLLTGMLPGFAAVQGVLFGLWQVLVSCYSNTNDVLGDASVGRRTVATMTTPLGNRVFIAILSAADVLLVCGTALAGVSPWWFAPAMLPQVALRVGQVTGFLRNGDALLARRRGLAAHQAGVLLLVIVNLCHRLAAG